MNNLSVSSRLSKTNNRLHQQLKKCVPYQVHGAGTPLSSLYMWRKVEDDRWVNDIPEEIKKNLNPTLDNYGNLERDIEEIKKEKGKQIKILLNKSEFSNIELHYVVSLDSKAKRTVLGQYTEESLEIFFE